MASKIDQLLAKIPASMIINDARPKFMVLACCIISVISAILIPNDFAAHHDGRVDKWTFKHAKPTNTNLAGETFPSR